MALSFRKVPAVIARLQPECQMIVVANPQAKPRRIATMLKWLAFAATCSILSFQSWRLKFTANLQRPRGQPSQFAIDFESGSFTLAGESVRILSGSVHYFRTPRELWMERLTYARAAGLNTIDTFVEWSSHEPEEGRFDFHGQRDLVAFLEMAHNLSFMVILRPGPYIGAERDMGGLPHWLLRTDSGIRLRTMDTRYIKFADRYLTELFKRIKHLSVRNGGPIIMVQVENKYGLSRKCNRTYLRHLRFLMRQELGSDTVLFTTDRVGVGAMSCGRIEGVYPAVAFGATANVSEAFATQRIYQKRGPLFVSELYTGWFDRWAMPHRHVDPAMVASALRQVLLAGASVNLFTFLAAPLKASMVAAKGNKGALFYRPHVTSYDFGGPLTEAGDPTELFVAVRRVISEASGHAWLPCRCRPVRSAAENQSRDQDVAGNGLFLARHSLPQLLDVRGKRRFSACLELVVDKGASHSCSKMSTNVYARYKPLSVTSLYLFELTRKTGAVHFYCRALLQAHGLMFYDVAITYQPHVPALLSVEGIRDGGHVYLNGVFVDSVSRAENSNALLIKAKLHQVLTVLVHNEGRISSGKGLSESKGIVSNVTLDRRLLTKWTMRPVPLTNATWLTNYAQMRYVRKQTSLRAARSPFELRVFAAKFELPASNVYDTFLRPDQKTKGIAFLNGFNLGRYWPARGPQKTLYVPRTLFRKENLLVLIELEGGFHRGGKPPVVQFVDKPELHGTVHEMDE
ncbi:beta-galactosidase-like [Dermacentor andersoni]|uniref:beta-galactosidase-like n=1 Tax=Dermacentor andersoni TaxID=34620 RepID=UPI002416C5D6|nr:beta-galactosidase-like [Dermacentor andersoni]